MKRVVACFVLALLVCGLVAPGVQGDGEKKSAKELIVGKWKMADTKELKFVKEAIAEFSKDGKVTFNIAFEEEIAKKIGKDEIKVTGTYKFVEDDVVETKMKDPAADKEKVERIRVEVTDNMLTTTDLDGKDKGKKHTFKRVK
jgi:uncharacterized protein (TIGR03066 family)